MKNTTLGICIPVWNRGDLFKICFKSLEKQLKGIDASIWIFDNGSQHETREIVQKLKSKQQLFKVFFPENMGIPYVVNLFCTLVSEDCRFTDYEAPEYVMLMDSDAYYKKPVKDLIEVLNFDNNFGIVSGHDSVEHEPIANYTIKMGRQKIKLIEKKNERMCCMVMRKDELRLCHPFPHHINRDVDWELTLWNRNSLAHRNRKLVSVDRVLHLGLYDSTWHPGCVPASESEMLEINKVLRSKGIFDEKRKKKFRHLQKELAKRKN